MNISLDSLIEEIENEHTEVINFLLSQRRRYVFDYGLLEYDDTEEVLSELDFYVFQLIFDIEEMKK